MSFQIYLKLSLQERTENYSEVFIRSIKNGGSSFSSDSKKLIEFLQHSFDEFDKIPYPQENINQLKNYLGIH